MPSGYPGAIDSFNNPTAVDNLNTSTVIHSAQHTNVNDAVKAIETELGLTPKGTAASVKARLDAVDVALGNRLLTSEKGAVNGLASLDAGGLLSQNVDAGKLTAGTVNLARLPNLPGTKIIGTATPSGAAIPIDAVPALDTGKTTTGIFAVARIPDLDAAKIATGTIAAARLPASATANANALVKADIASRDAIPVPSRVDGMLVIVRNPPKTLWAWNAATAAWDLVPDERDQWALATAAINTPLSGAWGVVGAPFTFNVVSGFNYAISGWLIVNNASSSTPDIKFGWGWTGTGTMHSSAMGVDTTVNSPAVAGIWQGAATQGDAATPMQPALGIGTPAGNPVSALIEATYQCTASGVISLQFGQLVSDASFASTIMAGSRMKCTRMG